jgi:hypothetical protein
MLLARPIQKCLQSESVYRRHVFNHLFAPKSVKQSTCLPYATYLCSKIVEQDNTTQKVRSISLGADIVSPNIVSHESVREFLNELYLYFLSALPPTLLHICLLISSLLTDSRERVKLLDRSHFSDLISRVS